MAVGGTKWVGVVGRWLGKHVAVGDSHVQIHGFWLLLLSPKIPSLISPGPPSMLGFHPPTHLSRCWFMQILPMWIGGLGLCSFSYCLACVHACPLYRSASIISIASSVLMLPVPMHSGTVEQEAEQAEKTINWCDGVFTFLIFCLGLSGPDVALSSDWNHGKSQKAGGWVQTQTPGPVASVL